MAITILKLKTTFFENVYNCCDLVACDINKFDLQGIYKETFF